METDFSHQINSADISQKIKVMIVDDEPVMLVYLEEGLKNMGYEVFSVLEPEKTLETVKSIMPDIILLDVVMPVTDGFEVCRQLKENPQINKIPIVFLTIRKNVSDKLEGFFSGGVDYLVKPFEINELATRINKHVEIFWLRDTLEKMLDKKNKQIASIQKQLVHANKFLMKYNSSYEKILSSLEEGIIRIDKTGICLFSNEAAALLLGYDSPEELQGNIIYEINPQRSRRKTDIFFNNQNLNKSNHSQEARLLKNDGKGLPIEFKVNTFKGDGSGDSVVICFNDITIRKSIEENLFTLAYKDPLTELANRTVFFEILQREIKLHNSRKHKIALLILDLDRFKEINDSLGHLEGDKILCEVARRLRKSVRTPDKAARLGGDEFSLVTDGFDNEEELLRLAQRIAESLKVPYELAFTRVNLTVSIGIAIFNEDIKSVETIMSYADYALYNAKELRVGNVCLFQPCMRADLEQEITVAHELSELLCKDELFVEYQPQFDITQNTYVGAEALVRWNHPQRGRLMPKHFLAIAEKRGFIKEISYYTLRKVCKQIGTWKKQQFTFGIISINVCAQQLDDKNFAQTVVEQMKKHNVSSKDIVLEFTETTLINIKPDVQKTLSHLTALGIKFAIDDFGTGFSSMHLLKNMHSDKLKIDKEFIAGIHNNEKSTKITKSLIDLSRSLGITVIAEGVEKKEQLDFLRQHGCDIFQGFYYSSSIAPQILQKRFFIKPQLEQ